MPNWCDNTLTLKHKDPAMIKRAFDALEKGAFLNEFVPIPESLHIVAGRVGDSIEQEALEAQEKLNEAQHGYKNWYDFCTNEWGPKWDVGDEGSQTLVNENELTTTFSSAWAPPTGAYAKLQDLGFEVEAYYYEPGMCFAGIYDENGDDFYNIDGSSESVRENIPQVLDEMFNISENMAEYEDENQEIELNDGIDSINE
jgi:hypothetical protein